MRLLPGYASSPALSRAVVVHASVTPAADILDAVAFDVLPVCTCEAQSAADLLRARTAIDLYSRVYEINEQPRGRLDVYG